MEWISLACRLALTVAFIAAAVAKLADRHGGREAVRAFGVPAPLAPAVASVLPVVELGLAVALLPATAAFPATLGVAVLLLVFTVLVGVNLALGRRPDCHCFGNIGKGPIGTRTLARNGTLFAIAASAAVLDSSSSRTLSATAWMADLSEAQAAAFGVALLVTAVGAALGWTLLQVIRQNGRLLVRIEALEATAPGPREESPLGAGAGLTVGTPAPTFVLPGVRGESITLDSLRANGRPVLLAFTDPGCGPCGDLLPDLGRWQHEAAGEVTIVLISRGSPKDNRAKADLHGLAHVLVQADREVMEAYRAEATPSMVLVKPDGTIGSWLAIGAEQIRALVARVIGGAVPVVQHAQGQTPCPQCGNHHEAVTPPVRPVAIGSAAPALRVPDLDGREIELAEVRDHETLLVFWNPSCGFCQQMLPDLKRLERQPSPGAPRLIIVSTGTREANAAEGFQAPVLLDESFQAARAFGAQGTPSAILLDASGRVASTLAVGAPAVLALARGEGKSEPPGQS